MILIVSSQGITLESKPDPQFGRAPFFIKYETENDEWNALENPAILEPGGAGVAAAQFIIKNKASVVISGRFGPNASKVFTAANLPMCTFTSDCDSIKEVIDLFQQGLLCQG